MINLLTLIYVALAVASVFFTVAWVLAWRRAPAGDTEDATKTGFPSPLQIGIGLVTDFFDALGIGSFAVTTTIFRLLRQVPDRLIPGTLLVGHTLPTFAQAFIFITIIRVEAATLLILVSAAVVGFWLGAGVVSRWPKHKIQVGMAGALLVAGAIILTKQLGLMPAGGAELGLSGLRLYLAIGGNLVLGALMTIGIGAYAPSLIMLGLLGMDTRSIFPIMMGSCAFLMPVSGLTFVRRGSYSPKAALGLTLGGVPGVFLAAFLVRELPIQVLNWLVLAVIAYTAINLYRSARAGRVLYTG